MKKNNFLAVYVNHSSATIMEFINDVIVTEIIESDFTHQQKTDALHKGESLMHHKENQLQLSYYHAILNKLKTSENVLLFGPTTAKMELHNLMKDDAHFNDTKVVCKQTDKLTDNQQQAFVKDYMKHQFC